MSRDDGWTCPCGHEIDPDSGDCIVWTPDSWPHFVPQNTGNGRVCRCHGYSVKDIERTFENKLRVTDG